MKNFYVSHHFLSGKWRKILFVMKLKLILLLLCVGQLPANTVYSQQPKIDVAYRANTITSVLNDLTKRTGYTFVYQMGVIRENTTVSLSMENASFTEVLDRVLADNGYQYSIEGKIVVVSREQAASRQQQTPLSSVSGIVRDADSKPLPGTAVSVKNTSRGFVTGVDGRYEISVRQGEVLVFSFLGKKQVEVAYTGQPVIDVRMEDDASEIEQVIVTGMFERRAESFTGSASTFTREQLQTVGNQNVLKSLSNLDPSFMIMENLEFGSDPNTLPTIQMRGQSSFPDLQGDYSGNPNQPLFILDGFEVSVEKVFDLDMNRVSTITILKDASAKAIYGSKAGNGVVVIETIRPQSGRIRVSYSGTLDIEAPDLTGYNLMDAREKLAFEVMAGVYLGTGQQVENPTGQNSMDRYYQETLRSVISGVDTDWLHQPLRTGVGHKHSVALDGGDESFRYGIGLNYNNVAGVLKGSKRETFSGNMNFGYTYKNLRFINTLELTINNATKSPYGNFSEYAKLNPYWRIYDDEGYLIPSWTFKDSDPVFNPLYNASLNTKDTSDYTEIRDNFQAEWNILSNLKLTGRFNFVSRTGGSDVFYPAGHTMFMGYSDSNSDRKGRYTKYESKSTSLNADLGVSYSIMLDRHLFFLNANWNMSSTKGTNHTYIAEGFGNENENDIAFGSQYMTGTHPTGGSDNQREVGVVGLLNYSFDDRYLFDASLRTSGSSMFGADNKWGMFWALGLGWNIHKERFAENALWLDQFKLRGSMGYTGSQNFDPYQAKAIYKYADHVYDGGYGAILMGLPNTKLQWQRVLDYNAGVDILLWKMLTIKFDYFLSITDDLLIDVALPPSTGFSTYKENLGKVENKGYEISVAVTPWRDAEKGGFVTVALSAMHNTNKIRKISDTFTHRNNEENASKDQPQASWNDLEDFRQQYTRPATLYYEGQSMNAIWGVRSAGINPMTGSELFYDRNGKIVTSWSSLDQVVLGDTSPKLRGNINLSAGYRGFSLSVVCSYKFGGDTYNTTLVDKLEYTTAAVNLDRRALQTWTQVGQIAPYKRLDAGNRTVATNLTKPTSRFVVKDNELYISSINVGYDFQNRQFLSKLGLERLRISAYMNELYRFSSIEIERGTSYPFARNFSFSLQATF